MSKQENKYDNKHECRNCGGPNKIKRYRTEDGHMTECYTECRDCGHENFWSYGYFESSDKLQSKTKVLER